MTTDQPQSPCKSFNKRRAITCYRLRFNLKARKFDHVELYRVTNETPKEYYVLPVETLQKQTNRHLSYHKSGAFHWREQDGSRVVPVDGEADDRRASLIQQAMAHLHGQLDGYCISRGRDVSDEAVKVMVEIMDGYIIPPLIALGVSESLKLRKNQTIPMMESPYQVEAMRLLEHDKAHGKREILSRADLLSSLKDLIGSSAKIFEIEPKSECFASYSLDATSRLLDLARQMVIGKLQSRPPAFWLNGSCDADT